MDYDPPYKLMEEVEAASKKKAGLPAGGMLVKGFLSGALLGLEPRLLSSVLSAFPKAPLPSSREPFFR